MTIPRTIHTCWFGGAEKPARIRRLLDSHRRVLPDYAHVEWNESNFPIETYPFIAKAYAQKRWAHVTDMVRLVVLREQGGFYLDTDIEVIRPFDPLLGGELVLGYMWDCNLGTAVIGAAPGNPVIDGLLQEYLRDDGADIDLFYPNNDLFTRYVMEHVPGFVLNGERFSAGGVEIHPKEVFEQPSFWRRRNFTVHHFSQTWKDGSPLKARVKRLVIGTFGLYLYRQYVCRKSLRISPFYDIYRRNTGGAA